MQIKSAAGEREFYFSSMLYNGARSPRRRAEGGSVKIQDSGSAIDIKKLNLNFAPPVELGPRHGAPIGAAE